MKHVVPAKVYDLMEAYVMGKKPVLRPSSDILYDAEVEMKNGTRFLIQVCACINETPYVQIVVIDEDGHELGCTSDGDTFGGRYVVRVGAGKEVVLDVVRAKPKKKVKKSTDTGLFCGVIPDDLAENKKLLKRVNTMQPKFGSALAYWKVIEIFDNEVPKKILAALEKEAKASELECSMYTLMWGDLFFYCGEDGPVLSDKTLKVVGRWLSKHRNENGLSREACFWFRVKRA